MQLSHIATHPYQHLSQTKHSRYSLANISGKHALRFDDRLETMLQINTAHESGRITIWRQVIDMLAQSGRAMALPATERCLVALTMLRSTVPLAVRAKSIDAVADRCNFPPLIAFLANDHPQVAIAAVDRANLSDSGWLMILSEIGPIGRSRLRQRDDIGPAVHRALLQFGSTDYALPPRGVSEATTHENGVQLDSVTAQAGVLATTAAPASLVKPITAVASQDIGELVRRIHAYQGERERAGPATISVRCDADGQIRALSGVSRARFVGISIAEPANPTEYGCDAGVARAFAKRAPIRDGRLFLGGNDDDSGYWLIDSDPTFARETGRFTGYTGTLRRLPVGDALKGDTTDGVIATQASEPVADSMRQLVHELRSPLNAISGFAQLIQGQFFGPVSSPYRQIAEAIVGDASHLTFALEDIDLAARVDMGGQMAEAGEGNFQDALAASLNVRRSDAAQAPVTMHISAPSDPVMVAVSTQDVAEMVYRLAAAITGIGSRGTVVGGTLHENTALGMATLACPFPNGVNRAELNSALAGDTSIASEQSKTVLGPGFALRLVAQIAQLHGGSLSLTNDQFILNLPLLNGSSDRFGAVN